MFVLAKLLSSTVTPTALMIELAVVGLLLRQRAPVAIAVALLALCMVLPVDTWAIRPLEDRFPVVTDPPARVDGIILLGGAIDDLTSQDRKTPVLNASANRLTSFVILAKRYPTARLVFTGGSGSIRQGDATEAPWTRELLGDLGVAPERVIFEDRSRTTWENAVEVNRLVQPKPGETWLLVTSAVHMPRAVGVFRKAGWTLLAWPAGYRSRDGLDTWLPSLSDAFPVLDLAAHEWSGLLVYWLQGHSSALFPAP